MFEIANGIGTPISLDEATRSRSLGHFARTLIEVHLNGRLPNEIMVKRNDFALFVWIKYENLPTYCSYCQMIGHDQANCNHKLGNQKKPRKERQPRSNAVYVPKQGQDQPAKEQIQEG